MIIVNMRVVALDNNRFHDKFNESSTSKTLPHISAILVGHVLSGREQASCINITGDNRVNWWNSFLFPELI